MRRRCAERAKDLDVLRRVRQVIFAADHVGDFHLEVVDHIHEMKNPRAIRTADCHVGMRRRIGEIEIDFAAHDVVDDDVLARRTKSQRTLVFEDVTGILKFLQVALVKFCALTLQIRSEIAADVRTFVPIQAQPLAVRRRSRPWLPRCFA